jgi:hypothetical protein
MASLIIMAAALAALPVGMALATMRLQHLAVVAMLGLAVRVGQEEAMMGRSMVPATDPALVAAEPLRLAMVMAAAFTVVAVAAQEETGAMAVLALRA